MKFKYIPLAYALLIFLTSCTKTEVTQTPTLVGRWYEKKQVIQTYANGEKISDTTITSFSLKDYMQFNNDGTGIISGSDTSDTFYTGNFAFTKSNNDLTLTRYAKDNGTISTTPYTIMQLAEINLTLHLEGTYTGPGNVMYKRTADMYFTKQN